MTTLAEMQLRRLENEVAELRRKVGLLSAENERLRKERSQSDERLRSQFNLLKKQNSSLANLYIASYRLHESLDREEILTGIQEIFANIVGSEEIAVLEMDPDQQHLRAIRTNGVDAKQFEKVSAKDGLIGQAVSTGKVFVKDGSPSPLALPHESELTACIPLRLAQGVSGAIAVFRLLQQKRAFSNVDHELFQLVATHAATALYCTKLHSRVAARAS